jgi:hypothetical protein
MKLIPLQSNLQQRHTQIKPMCKYGHPKKNQPGGQRYCPTCQAAAQRAWRAKQ